MLWGIGNRSSIKLCMGLDCLEISMQLTVLLSNPFHCDIDQQHEKYLKEQCLLNALLVLL